MVMLLLIMGALVITLFSFLVKWCGSNPDRLKFSAVCYVLMAASLLAVLHAMGV